MNKILTMMDIKKARDGIAAAFSVDTMTAARLIGFYNGAGDVATVAALVAGDYTSIPAAAAALGVSLQGVKAPETVGGAAGDDRPAGGGAPSDKKSAGSIKKENDTRKADTTTAAHTDDITAHNGDILPDTARNRKADKIPADSKSKPKKAKKAAYNGSITAGALTTMDSASRPESSDDLPQVQGDILPPDSAGVLPDNVPALVMDVINSYCNQNNISDLSKERQPRWSAACCMVGESVFKKSKILHDTLREKQHGGTVYDVGRVSALVDLWRVLCNNFCKVPLVDDFARFAGVTDSWLYGVGSPEGLTPARSSLLQKLKRAQESGLAGMIVDGRQNPTGALAALNHWHGWTQTREIVHTSGAAAPVAPSLPVFDGAGGLLVDNSSGGVDN